MSGTDRRAHWRPWAGHEAPTPAPSITEAIHGLTERVIAFREEKEKGMSETEAPQQASVPPAPVAPAPAPAATPLPPAPTITPPAAPAALAPKPAPGGFAASLRAMMDEARDGVAKARADGLAMVKDAVGKLEEAKQATAKVAGNMASQIHDEAASVMAELGQISNDL